MPAIHSLRSGTVRSALRSWYAVVILCWIGRYATLDYLPFTHDPVWTEWFDQSRYLASATGFAHGDLSANAHWYPLGYALVSVPLVWLIPHNPFFLPDLALFLVTCRAFQRVAETLGIGKVTATGCFLATTLVQTGLASAWVTPWTTTLSAAIIWWLIALVVEVGIAPESSRPPRFVLIGALLGSLPLIRPLDIVLSATLGVVVFAIRFRHPGRSLSAFLALILGGGAIIALYGMLHLAIYGPHPTPYMMASAQTGFVFGDLGWKAFTLLVNPRPWYPDSLSMLQVLPWIVPGCAGLIATMLIGERRMRWIVALLFSAIIPISVVMLAYADLQPPGLWYFGNVHYFKWVMPAFGLGVVLCWKLIQRPFGQRVIAGTLVALCLPLGIRITPEPVGDGVPARMLLYRGIPGRDFHEAYFSPVTIVDSRGPMRNVVDFHQLPDRMGQREIAIRRLFGRTPRRFDPGEARAYDGQQPYARFGERISYLGLFGP